MEQMLQLNCISLLIISYAFNFLSKAIAQRKKVNDIRVVIIIMDSLKIQNPSIDARTKCEAKSNPKVIPVVIK